LTRDNILFILIGILAGFIAGYLMHDVMAARQPARLVHGQAAAMPDGANGAAAAGANQQAAAEQRVQEMQQLQTFVQNNPDNTEAIKRLANLAYDAQAWQLCVANYERLIELTQEDPDVLSDLGVCYRQIGEPQKALKAFERAQELQPDHWQSRYNEVVILALDLGEFDRAEKVLAELRKLQPDNPDVDRLAAEVQRRQASS
jgi:tetratricopeptide (TPR) repeat protein